MLTRNKSHVGSSFTNEANGRKYSTEKCRICLADGEIPIFGTNDISEDVTEFGQITVGKDDNLPQYLCDDCHKLLEAAILFRKTAKQSDEALKRTDTDSDTEDTDQKLEDETYIKKEYLEFNYTSESEAESFALDKVKHEDEYDTSSYNPTFSEANTQDSEDSKGFQADLLHVKQEEDSSVTEADLETIMIVVGKDKQKLVKGEKDFDSDEEITEHNDKSLTSEVLPHQIECEVCHTIVEKRAYRKHLTEHREKYKQRFNRLYGKIECEYCGKHVSKAYMKIHLIKAHGSDEEKAVRLIKCTICNKTYNKYYYKIHVLKKHPNRKENKDNVKQIIMQQDPPTPPNYKKCPVCDKEVIESEYKLHLERHNGPLKRFICDKCGKVFKHPSAFKTHCMTHGKELKFKCQFCPYRGLHQGLLKIHVRTHTGDYNYKCTECPARFITKSNLSKHLDRHNRHYSYKCDFCDKGFYTKRELDKHTNFVHLSIRNHICELCGKAYGHRDNMLNHQLKVHKRDKVSRGRIPTYLKVNEQ